MLLLLILLSVFLFVLLLSRIVKGEFKSRVAGRMGLSAMLIFTGIGHFLFPLGMSMMLPSFMPFKLALVYATGVLEFAAALGILVPKLQKVTAWLLILFFILILPSNIYAALFHVDYQQADYGGKGLNYLWLRIPLQIFLIAWTYYFGIYADRKRHYALETT